MEMNIKFEWTHAQGVGLAVHSYGRKGVEVGSIDHWDDGSIDARFGSLDARHDIPTLDEAKAWVEEQAREWLAEVTA